MTNRLNVLIVEDDEGDRNALVKEVKANADKLCFVDAVGSSERALEVIREHKPHAIILDLELQDGSGDGLELLEKLHSIVLSPKPYIVVNTNSASKVNRISAKKKGADYEFAKWQKGYSPKMVTDHLIRVMPEILGCEEETPAPLTEQQQEKRMREFVQDEFNKLGVSIKNEGYNYLVDAVILAANGESQNWGKTLGAKYGKSEDSINHAMKYAIDRTWTKGDTNNLLKYYTAPLHNDKGAPTVYAFVFFYKQQLIKQFN